MYIQPDISVNKLSKKKRKTSRISKILKPNIDSPLTTYEENNSKIITTTSKLSV